jgi:hypothetical protein
MARRSKDTLQMVRASINHCTRQQRRAILICTWLNMAGGFDLASSYWHSLTSLFLLIEQFHLPLPTPTIEGPCRLMGGCRCRQNWISDFMARDSGYRYLTFKTAPQSLSVAWSSSADVNWDVRSPKTADIGNQTTTWSNPVHEQRPPNVPLIGIQKRSILVLV